MHTWMQLLVLSEGAAVVAARVGPVNVSNVSLEGSDTNSNYLWIKRHKCIYLNHLQYSLQLIFSPDVWG